MADINSVLVKIRDSEDEACAVAGVPTPAETLAAANARIDQLTADKSTLQGQVTTLQARITDALAEMDQADAGDATEDAARARARAKLVA